MLYKPKALNSQEWSLVYPSGAAQHGGAGVAWDTRLPFPGEDERQG